MLTISVGAELAFVPQDVLKAMERIGRAGFRVWLVGGAVRDHLLGLEPRDWDLVTNAASSDIMSIFPSVVPVGIRHGTVQVHTRCRDMEVTSFSGDSGIVEDLGRRDFTINSLAISYPEGVLLDPNRGREDLGAGLIRAVGEARARFSEDPLRIVRAARICGVYGFEIEPETFEAMKMDGDKLGSVSGERVRDEILKILVSANVPTAFGQLKECGALAHLIPEVEASASRQVRKGGAETFFDHTLCSILHCPRTIRTRLAALFHHSMILAGQADWRPGSADIAAKTMKGWNMSKRLINEVHTLIGHQLGEEAFGWRDARIRGFITEVGAELLDDFLALGEAEALCGGWREPGAKEQMERLGARIKNQLGLISAFSVRELALGGNDLTRILGISPGPEVGKMLKELFELVLEEPSLNTREALIRTVEAIYGK